MTLVFKDDFVGFDQEGINQGLYTYLSSEEQNYSSLIKKEESDLKTLDSFFCHLNSI